MKQFIHIERVDQQKKSPLLFVILSAVLTMISLTFFDLAFLAWFSQIFIFLYFMNSAMTAKRAFLSFFIYGLVFNMLYLHWLFNLHPLTWMGYSMTESFVLTFLAWFSLSIFEALFYAVFAFIAFLSKPKSSYLKGIMVLMILLLVEWSREIDVLGFPWGKISLSQYRYINLIQTASLFGMIFVSFIILTVNYLLASSVTASRNSKSRNAILFIIFAVMVFSSNMLFGHFVSNRNFDGNVSYNVSIIQGNIGVSDKWTDPLGETVKDKHYRITREAVSAFPDTQLVFWAETALAANLTTHPEILGELTQLSDDIDRPLIIGTLLYDDGLRNSIVFIDKDGIGDIYHKRHPVPVGEYIPFKELVFKVFPKAADSRIASEGLVAGTDSALISIGKHKLGALVCYDSIFPLLSLDATKDGANILFVASNDSWYKRSSALEQHNAQSVFRAVETRKYIIRAANTGISSVISPSGELIGVSDANVEYILNASVYPNDHTSLYVKTGNLFLYLVTVAYLILISYGIFKNSLSRK